MSFFLFKLIQLAFVPSNAIALMAVLGLLALLLRRRRTGITLLVVSNLALFIAGWSPVGPALVMMLEDRFPAPVLPETVTGVVMLGGAVDIHVSQDRNQIVVNDNAERITTVAELARRFPQARLILSGGVGHEANDTILTEAEGGRRMLVDLGVPSDRLELEDTSRTTYENAVASLAVAKPQPGETWLLVTSAFHMPRAVASFRAVGFPVVPYPVDYRTRPADLRRPIASLTGGLGYSDAAAHEFLGLLGYRLTGKTTTMLPAPE